ncbi:unnamed protein product [Prunus armeniaca]
MDVTESTEGMRLTDEESIDVSMGGDTSAANAEDKESSPRSKKPRGITIGKRKLRSSAWETFDLLPLGEDKKRRAKCRNCETIYVCDSRCGTGNLLNHAKNCLKKPHGDVKQLLMSSSGLRSPKFDHIRFRNLLIEAIIKHNLPFSFVEYEGVRALFAYVSPDIKLPCRNTVKACVLRMFKSERQKLQSLLSSVQGRICLTSDLWTSLCTDGYLALTAHFVDKDWRLQKRIINFCHMPPPHSGVALSEKINTLLTEWGIEKKLFSITLDNASANTAFVDILTNQLNFRSLLLMGGKFFHVRCCAHILNLIVQDGLKEIDSSVTKIRECVKYIKGSEARKQKFYDCVAQVGIVGSKRGLRQDVPTRWNSTYTMLDSALFYHRAFINLGLIDSNFSSCPSPQEWIKVEKISKFLGYFYEVTCLFSGTKYPTSNLFFPKIFIIQHQIKAAIEDDDIFMNKIGTNMSMKFEKYWSEYSLILAIAIILDPRYKLHFVEWAYTKLHGKDSREFKGVTDTLTSLFHVYTETLSPLLNASFPTNETTSHNEGGDTILEDFDNSYKNGSSSCKKNELHKYLDEERLDRKQDIDVLSWWQMEHFHYPILSHLARDVLTIPISTVASESAFSIGGRVLDQYRSSLLPQTVQALLCTRDWLFGNEGNIYIA